MLDNTIENDLSQTPLSAMFDGSAALETQELKSETVKKIPRHRRHRNKQSMLSLFPDGSEESCDNAAVIPLIMKNGNDTAKASSLSCQKIVPDTSQNDVSAPAPELEYSEIGGCTDDAIENGQGAGNSPLSCSGIIYEIAEELYVREKTASELEALFDPPFHKNFSSEELADLDRHSEENARTIAAGRNDSVFGKRAAGTRPITTSTAFILQSVMLVPILNIVAALFLAFRSDGSINIKAYCRAFLIWAAIIMTSALIFFAWSYYSVSSDRPQLVWLFPYLK